MNLESSPRSDFVTIDANLTVVGHKAANLLAAEQEVAVEERDGRYVIHVPLASHELAILKLGSP